MDVAGNRIQCTVDFADVDATPDPARMVAYLDGVRSSPHWERLKTESLAMLELTPGAAALDVGCGTGDEVVALAATVGVDGLGLGIDRSEVMVNEARRRHFGRGLPVGFQVADAVRLPFPDGCFAGCRVERTLQHVVDPAAAVVEVGRVLTPGGHVLLIEPDWETLVYDAPTDVGRRIVDHFIAQATNPRVGRQLRRLLIEAGLRPTHVDGRAVPFETYQGALIAVDLEAAARDASRAGVVGHVEADDWLSVLRARDANGCFYGTVTVFTVVGRK
jgi:SAM-dependent methyltransferase